MPCSECGASVDRAAASAHVCDPERRVDFEMFGMRDELAGFESRLSQFLLTTTGQFEVWLAARQVRDGTG